VPACVKNSDSCGSGCLAAAADYAKRDETGAQQSEAGRLGHRGYAAATMVENMNAASRASSATLPTSLGLHVISWEL
jgi:hypothetical protein